MANTGHVFRNHRIAKNITLKTAQNATHLRSHVITAIETDDFGYFHSFAQLKGFATIYAEYLGILSDDILIDLKFAYQAAKPTKKQFSVKEKPETVETKSDQPPSLPEFQQTYQRIGAIFRERRERLNISPEEAEWHSHIRAGVITKIEAGNLEDFGSPIQAKGLMISYAHFLEIDPESIETMFGEAILSKRFHSNSGAQKPAQATRRPKKHFLFGLINWDTIVIGSVVLTILALFLWASVTFMGKPESIPAEQTSTLSVSDVLLETGIESTNIPLVEIGIDATPTSEVILDEGGELIQELPTQAESGNVNVTLIILEKAYLRVIVDGEEVLNTRGIVGNALVYHAEEMVEILTGSGRSVKVIFNGQDLGTMGNYGESVLRIFSPSGVITPTPSITPTPTITPSPTITPRPTLTPKPSATISN